MRSSRVCVAANAAPCAIAVVEASNARLFAVAASSLAVEASSIALEALFPMGDMTSTIEDCTSLLLTLPDVVALYERGAHMPNTMEAATVSTPQVHLIAKEMVCSRLSDWELDRSLSLR